MNYILAVGSGINLKNGKKIVFTVSEATSRKGLEGLAKNVFIKKMVVIPDSPHEKIAELLELKKKIVTNELGFKRVSPSPDLNPHQERAGIISALLDACLKEGTVMTLMTTEGALEFNIRNISDAVNMARALDLDIIKE